MPISPATRAWLHAIGRETIAAAFKGTGRVAKWAAQLLAVVTVLVGPQVRGDVVWTSNAGDANVADSRFLAALGLVVYVVGCVAYAVARSPVCRVGFAGTINGDEGGGLNDHCRVKVANTSMRDVQGCGVALIRSKPLLPHLPLPLHCQHEKRPDSRVVNLAPGEERVFDVAARHPNRRGFVFKGAGFEPEVLAGHYLITLRLTAGDSLPIEKDFIVKPGPMGPLIEEVAEGLT